MVTFTTTTYSQNIDSLALTEEIRTLKQNAWMTLTMGLFSNLIGTSHLIGGGKLNDPNVSSPFIMYNSIGLGFDIFAIVQFNKIRKKKKELKQQ